LMSSGRRAARRERAPAGPALPEGGPYRAYAAYAPGPYRPEAAGAYRPAGDPLGTYRPDGGPPATPGAAGPLGAGMTGTAGTEDA
jgi:hypothetical protein